MLEGFKRLPDPLDALTRNLIADMAQLDPESDEYLKLLTRLERIYELKTHSRPKRVSPDTLWTVGGNLAGILVIVMYEQRHVFVSRAQAFLLKPR